MYFKILPFTENDDDHLVKSCKNIFKFFSRNFHVNFQLKKVIASKTLLQRPPENEASYFLRPFGSTEAVTRTNKTFIPYFSE